MKDTSLDQIMIVIIAQTLFVMIAIIGTALGRAFGQRRLMIRETRRVLFPEIRSMSIQASVLACEIARRHDAGLFFDKDFFSQWRLSVPLIYPSLGSRLGMLSFDAIDRIGYFHAQLAEARARLAEMQSLKDTGSPHVSIYRLLSNLCRACNHVEPWIREHEAHFGAGLFRQPDMTGADLALERFEMRPSEPLAVPYEWADTCRPSDIGTGASDMSLPRL